MFSNLIITAQENIEKKPSKAALYSSIIPGSGQLYTKNYWRIPIIYAGLISSGYYTHDNYTKYILYKNTFINRLNGKKDDEYVNIYSDADLETLTDHYRRNTEISAFLFIFTYILNIVDASVNAHLMKYDINEDISINLQTNDLAKKNNTIINLSIRL